MFTWSHLIALVAGLGGGSGLTVWFQRKAVPKIEADMAKAVAFVKKEL
jgi:hypothetical protein